MDPASPSSTTSSSFNIAQSRATFQTKLDQLQSVLRNKMAAHHETVSLSAPASETCSDVRCGPLDMVRFDEELNHLHSRYNTENSRQQQQQQLPMPSSIPPVDALDAVDPTPYRQHARSPPVTHTGGGAMTSRQQQSYPPQQKERVSLNLCAEPDFDPPRPTTVVLNKLSLGQRSSPPQRQQRYSAPQLRDDEYQQHDQYHNERRDYLDVALDRSPQQTNAQNERITPPAVKKTLQPLHDEHGRLTPSALQNLIKKVHKHHPPAPTSTSPPPRSMERTPPPRKKSQGQHNPLESLTNSAELTTTATAGQHSPNTSPFYVAPQHQHPQQHDVSPTPKFKGAGLQNRVGVSAAAPQRGSASQQKPSRRTTTGGLGLVDKERPNWQTSLRSASASSRSTATGGGHTTRSVSRSGSEHRHHDPNAAGGTGTARRTVGAPPAASAAKKRMAPTSRGSFGAATGRNGRAPTTTVINRTNSTARSKRAAVGNTSRTSTTRGDGPATPIGTRGRGVARQQQQQPSPQQLRATSGVRQPAGSASPAKREQSRPRDGPTRLTAPSPQTTSGGAAGGGLYHRTYAPAGGAHYQRGDEVLEYDECGYLAPQQGPSPPVHYAAPAHYSVAMQPPPLPPQQHHQYLTHNQNPSTPHQSLVSHRGSYPPYDSPGAQPVSPSVGTRTTPQRLRHTAHNHNINGTSSTPHYINNSNHSNSRLPPHDSSYDTTTASTCVSSIYPTTFTNINVITSPVKMMSATPNSSTSRRSSGGYCVPPEHQPAHHPYQYQQQRLSSASEMFPGLVADEDRGEDWTGKLMERIRILKQLMPSQ
eukprot:PhM_4_TR15184/c1_g1_i2/m.46621